MRYCVSLVFVVLLFVAAAAAQVSPTPTPATSNSRQSRPSPVSVDTAKFERLRAVELMLPRNPSTNHPVLDPRTGIYRRPSSEEISILAVSEPLRHQYSRFLKEPNTGIVKLNSDSTCISNAGVIVANEKCMAFKMPGAGTAYSFRTESYRLPRLADVILYDGIFMTGGVFQQVVMADIGDVPIENVTLETAGMKYLIELLPVRNGDEFERFDVVTVNGIEANGLLYRKGQPVVENSTFVLRSIAYRGTYLRTVDKIIYDELEFDKRRDIIVAFRVVEKDASGNITIIWKRLADEESPKLRMKK